MRVALASGARSRAGFLWRGGEVVGRGWDARGTCFVGDCKGEVMR